MERLLGAVILLLPVILLESVLRLVLRKFRSGARYPQARVVLLSISSVWSALATYDYLTWPSSGPDPGTFGSGYEILFSRLPRWLLLYAPGIALLLAALVTPARGQASRETPKQTTRQP